MSLSFALQQFLSARRIIAGTRLKLQKIPAGHFGFLCCIILTHSNDSTIAPAVSRLFRDVLGLLSTEIAGHLLVVIWLQLRGLRFLPFCVGISGCCRRRRRQMSQRRQPPPDVNCDHNPQKTIASTLVRQSIACCLAHVYLRSYLSEAIPRTFFISISLDATLSLNKAAQTHSFSSIERND